MTREIEQLCQPKHDVSQWIVPSVDARRRCADRGGGNRQCRQHKRINVREGGVDVVPKLPLASESADVVFRQHVAGGFEPVPVFLVTSEQVMRSPTKVEPCPVEVLPRTAVFGML